MFEVLSPSSNDLDNRPEVAKRSAAAVCLVAVWTVIVGLVGFLSAPAALAHDAVVASTPADGSTVTTFPDKIEVEFSGEPRENFNTFAVTKADDSTMIAKGTPDIDGRFLSLSIPSDVKATPGEYIIGFQITSSDGHATRGKLSFTYQPDDAAESPAASSNDSTADNSASSSSTGAEDGDIDQNTNAANDSDGGLPLGGILGLILAVIVLIGLALFIISKRKN